METVELGATGLIVSRLGFGCAAIGGYDYGEVRDSESVAAIHAALDHGINFFDTADVYGFGHAEAVLSEALRDRQDSCVIATKVGVRWDSSGRTWRDLSGPYVRAAVDECLRRLRVNVIDICQLHWPDPEIDIEETLEAIDVCRQEGKVRFLGCSNFHGEELAALIKYGVVAVQVPYSLAQQSSRPTLDEVARLGRAGIAYNALAQGLFTGKFGPHSTFVARDLRSRSSLFKGAALARNLQLLNSVVAIATERAVPPATVALRWVLDSAPVTTVLAGAKTVAQVSENSLLAGWSLTQEELRRLNS